MSSEKPSASFNLPYNQSGHYWLAVFIAEENTELSGALSTSCGMQPLAGHGDVLAVQISNPWAATWKCIYEVLQKHGKGQSVDVALVAAEEELAVEQFTFARKPMEMVNTLADSLWLGDAMMQDRLVCYMQPVIDKRDKVFGYEAFARVETDKEPIAGGKIIEASRGLNAEYMLDRHLHIKAITSFISSDLEGFLFINFVPGFIHRPEKYLEGLTDSARAYGMPSKKIVLDFTQSETPRDIAHLKAIFDYCRSKGYSLSLDDISSVAMAKRILETIHPDFIKLDIDLVRNALGKAEQRTISELVALSHASGATVLAEGVETEAIHQELLKAGVDLFQGYLFSPPVAVKVVKEALKLRPAGA